MNMEAARVAARVVALGGAVQEVKLREPRFCGECGAKMKVALPLGFHFCPRRCVRE